MSKKITIITSIILLIIMLGIIFFIYSNKKNKAVSLENQSTVYENSAIVYDISNPRELIETIEDTTIQGIVELNHNGYIYIFNGQHFGEYGFEMEEYTNANIDNKNQECIDYRTSEKHDTSYIEEGDILICTGTLTKYALGDNDLDTKDNPIIVLKANDYNTIKEEAINGKIKSNITVGEYFDNDEEVYIKYDISDGKYKLPFVLKFNITKDTKIIGKLEKGKTVKIEYKDLSVPVNELELKQIEVVK